MISQAIYRQQVVPGRIGPLTAAQAWEIAYPVAAQYDPQARLTLIVSDDDISDQGESHQWSFHFDLPQQRAQAIIRVASDPAVETSDLPPLLCIEQVRPFPEEDSVMATWLAQGSISQEAVNEQWQRHLDNRPALPIPFRDSPEAVRALREQGVDFISGDSDMVLSGKVLPDGQAVWGVMAYGVEYQTPFAPPESGDP